MAHGLPLGTGEAPAPGQGVGTTIGDESDAAPEAACRTGSVVVHELLRSWARYGSAIPGG
jgi:hypothetical protein